MKYCQKCGTPMEDKEAFCTICGAKAEEPAQQPQGYQPYQPQQPQGYQPYQPQQPMGYQPQQQPYQPQQSYQGYQQNRPAAQRSVAAFVVGLIGAIFGMFGGMCVAACSSFIGNDGIALFMLVGGSVVGLIGACMCLSKAKIGGLLQMGGAVMIAICAFTITGADFMTLIGMLMLAIGGLCGLLSK